MKKTRWIAAALAAACALTLLAAGCKNSSDDSDEPDVGYDAAEWLIDDDTVIKYRGTATAVTIPEGITVVGERAFYGCAGLKSVTIPDGVAIIEDYAFYGCASLTGVTIPDSVLIIGWSAFSGCASLKSVALGKGVTSIGSDAFNGCASLASVTYAGTLAQWCAVDNDTNLMSYARSVTMSDGTDLKTMTALVIPEGVTSVGSDAFRGCENLASVTYNGSLAQWCGIDWKNGYANPLNNGKAALYFGDKKLTEADIPEGVTEIKAYAFYGCKSLESVKIPDGVTSIGDDAFYGCTSLTGVKIPEGVTEIKAYAFYGCSGLTGVTIPDGVTSIGSSAFNECTSLTGVTIPASVTSIGGGAFYGCENLVSVTYNGSLEQWCGIDWKNGYANPLYYGNAALYFGDKELTEADIPSGMAEIKAYAFYGCESLESVKIPEGVTSIGDNAFSGCSNLASVTIPASLKSVASGGYYYSAFYSCYNLADVYYNGTEEQWKKIKGIDNCGLSWRVTIHGKDADGNDNTWKPGD